MRRPTWHFIGSGPYKYLCKGGGGGHGGYAANLDDVTCRRCRRLHAAKKARKNWLARERRVLAKDKP